MDLLGRFLGIGVLGFACLRGGIFSHRRRWAGPGAVERLLLSGVTHWFVMDSICFL